MLIIRVVLSVQLLVFSLCAFSFEKYEPPGRIEIFHNNGHQVKGLDSDIAKGIEISVYNFDLHVNLEKELNSSISVNGKPASEIKGKKEIEMALSQVREAVAKARANKKFEGIFSAAILAKRYKLKKYPAMVINSGDEVMYGITDIELALKFRKEKAKKDALGNRYESKKNEHK